MRSEHERSDWAGFFREIWRVLTFRSAPRLALLVWLLTVLLLARIAARVLRG